MKHNINFFDKQCSFKKDLKKNWRGSFFLDECSLLIFLISKNNCPEDREWDNMRKESGLMDCLDDDRRKRWYYCAYIRKGELVWCLGHIDDLPFLSLRLLLPLLNLFPHSLFILLPPCCTPSPFILINLLFSPIHSHLYVPLPQVSLHLSLCPPHLSPTPPRLCQGCPL